MNGAGAADAQAVAEQSVRALHAADRSAHAFGIEIRSIAPGTITATMRVRPEMTNGHGICHGGMIFMLADSSFAFACNSHGASALAAHAAIDFLAQANEGDLLTASAREVWTSGRSGLYEVEVANQAGTRIAIFRGRSQRIQGRPGG